MHYRKNSIYYTHLLTVFIMHLKCKAPLSYEKVQ